MYWSVWQKRKGYGEQPLAQGLQQRISNHHLLPALPRRLAPALTKPPENPHHQQFRHCLTRRIL